MNVEIEEFESLKLKYQNLEQELEKQKEIYKKHIAYIFQRFDEVLETDTKESYQNPQKYGEAFDIQSKKIKNLKQEIKLLKNQKIKTENLNLEIDLEIKEAKILFICKKMIDDKVIFKYKDKIYKSNNYDYANLKFICIEMIFNQNNVLVEKEEAFYQIFQVKDKEMFFKMIETFSQNTNYRDNTK